MLKNILDLNGVKELNKKEQKSLQGGFGPGFCYMPNATTCCCFFSDRGPNGDFICGNGRPNLPEAAGQGACVFG